MILTIWVAFTILVVTDVFVASLFNLFKQPNNFRLHFFLLVLCDLILLAFFNLDSFLHLLLFGLFLFLLNLNLSHIWVLRFFGKHWSLSWVSFHLSIFINQWRALPSKFTILHFVVHGSVARGSYLIIGTNVKIWIDGLWITYSV